jgi:NADH:ubiquinone oxidoreductase subunit 3 (subunit A)
MTRDYLSLQARQTFSVSFYLVSIMYLLFDIEICYLFPYVMCHANAQVGKICLISFDFRKRFLNVSLIP